ncbi:MAG: TetR/AcrR family transcriptional regulator [Pseudomonadota bacterium]
MASEHLEATALRLFGLRGVDGVSIAEIATAAGMSKANVMHHYGSKGALYGACLQQVGHRIKAAAQAATNDATPDPVSAVGRELDRWAADYPDDVYLMAFGLLRLRDRPGPWLLDEAIASVMVALDVPHERGAELIFEQFGRLTYAAMLEPLQSHLDAAARAHEMPATTSPDP